MGRISLRRMLDTEGRLSAYCLNLLGQVGRPPCSHGNTVDIARLIAVVGEEVDLYSPEVQRHFVCKRCGARGAKFICAPGVWSTGSAGRDAYYAKLRREGEG